MIRDPGKHESAGDTPGEPDAPPHLDIWSLIHRDGSAKALGEAVERLGAVLGRSAEDPVAWCLLSEALLARGQPEESLDAALEAMNWADEDDPEPAFRAGLALYEMAAILENEPWSVEGPAIDALLRFAEITTDLPPARERTYLAEALAMFERSAILERHTGAPRFWTGVCLLNLGRLRESLEALEQACDGESSPDALADTWFLRGLALEAMDRRKSAGEAYRVALAHDPAHTGAAVRLEWLDPTARRDFLDAPAARTLREHLERALGERLLAHRDEATGAPTETAGAIAGDTFDGASGEEAEARLSDACPGTLELSRGWAEDRGLDPDRIESYLVYHGAACDCEAVAVLDAPPWPDGPDPSHSD